jgi:hypothetical protein
MEYTFRDRLSRLRKSEGISFGKHKERKEEKSEHEQTEKTSWLLVSQEPEFKKSEIKVSIGGFEVRIEHDIDEAVLLKVCRTIMKLC